MTECQEKETPAYFPTNTYLPSAPKNAVDQVLFFLIDDESCKIGWLMNRLALIDSYDFNAVRGERVLMN